MRVTPGIKPFLKSNNYSFVTFLSTLAKDLMGNGWEKNKICIFVFLAKSKDNERVFRAMSRSSLEVFKLWIESSLDQLKLPQNYKMLILNVIIASNYQA